ncbi:MAG TPA: recombinase family protein [Gemmataceae bacterium]|jgi:DNA invertase Pin-like site-specific DNA recombinase
MTKLAAIYIRMSTDKQEDSPERQRATTKQTIEREGFRFYREYIDEARRGWDDTRPGFRQLLADAQAKKFDIIVVDECSRLSRDEPLDFFAEVAHPLKKAGVRLYSVAEGGLQDWNNLPGVLLSAVYQDRSSGESKKTAWRVTTNYLKLSAEGRIDLGKPPYGYKRVWVDSSGRVVHEGTHPPEHVRRIRPSPRLERGDPAEVRVVQFIFDAYANRDMSLRDIGHDLERRGILTPTGKRVWSQNCVGRILREMKYAGYYVFNRVRQGEFYRLGAEVVELAGGFETETGMNPRETWRIIPNHHEPLVSPETFARVQELLAANKTRTTPAPNRGDFLLTKLLFCGACGGPMVGHRNGPGKPAFYRCQRAMDTAQHHCQNNLVKESEVLDNILAALEEQFLDPRFLDLCVREAQKMDEETMDSRRVNALRAELTALDRDIDRARSRLAKVDDEEFEFLNGQIAGWKARKKEVEAELHQAGTPCLKKRTEELLHWLEGEIRRLRVAVQSKDRQCVRAVIRRIVDFVNVGVECRLVGKVKNRYFLVGGDIVVEDGTGKSASRSARRSRCGRGDDGAVKYVSTSSVGAGNGEEAGATVSLSASGPTVFPR